MNSYVCMIIFVGCFGCCLAVKCYDCSYTPDRPNVNAGCNEGDSFNKTGIDTKECGGECKKQWLNNALYRSCAETCDEMEDGNDLVECCDDNLCNAALPPFNFLLQVCLATAVAFAALVVV